MKKFMNPEYVYSEEFYSTGVKPDMTSLEVLGVTLVKELVLDGLEHGLKNCYTMDDVLTVYQEGLGNAVKAFVVIPIESMLYVVRRRLDVLGLQSDTIIANLRAASEIL